MKYARYLGMPTLILIAVFFASKGQYWGWVYLISLDILIIAGDALLGHDIKVPNYKHTSILTILLYINLPIYLLFLTVAIYMGGHEYFPALERGIYFLTGHDISATRSGTELWHLAGYVFAGGLLMGASLTVPGHELVHHKKNKWDWFMGNWMMVFTLDNAFTIEHVHGHHKNVGIASDPATAKQGQSFYAFFFKSTFGAFRDATTIESSRLTKNGYKFFSLHNQLLQGYSRSLLVVFVVYIIGGLGGLLVYLGIVIFAKFFLEITNYMEHYGLVRAPGTPVSPKHSWNSNRRVSSILLYNLTRHSHHHEQGNLPFWKLHPYPYAPEMPYGYLTTLYLVTFFPGKYRKMMEPKLKEWKENFASEEEITLMA